MPALKSFPVFYPPDGLYYIFSRDLGGFWRQRISSLNTDGGLIDCIPLTALNEDPTISDRVVSRQSSVQQEPHLNTLSYQWEVITVVPATKKLGPHVSFQCPGTVRASGDEEQSVGYMTKKVWLYIPNCSHFRVLITWNFTFSLSERENHQI